MQVRNRRHACLNALLIVAVVSLVAIALPTSAYAGNDLMTVSLRTDIGNVYSADDFRTHVYATSMTNVDGSFTNAWIGVFLNQYNGTTGSGEFSQVGMTANGNGLTWFVYAEPGVTCLRGIQSYGTLGCTGNAGDLGFAVGTWHTVELVTYGQGYWIARVWDASGTTSADVAWINSSSLQIYHAEDTSEEGYNGTTDPRLAMNYFHHHPEYDDAVYGWTDWPSSYGGTNNFYYVNPSTVCPSIYGANLNVSGDPRYWQIVSGATTCMANPIF